MENNCFWGPLWGLGATYYVHLRLIGKLVGDFLLVIIELFSLGAFVLSQCTRLSDGQTALRSPKYRVRRVAFNAAHHHWWTPWSVIYIDLFLSNATCYTVCSPELRGLTFALTVQSHWWSVHHTLVHRTIMSSLPVSGPPWCRWSSTGDVLVLCPK